MKRLAVIGTGYVGLVSGAMFASVGNRVTCVDKDSRIVEALRAGRCTIHEPGLEEILRAAIAEDTIQFSTDISSAVETADAVFIAVGTPSLESGIYDFRYVEAAAREIGRALTSGRRVLIVLKSTVTPDIYCAKRQPVPEPSSRYCPTPSSSPKAPRCVTSVSRTVSS
jgi:UDPglucose 6-dehydrogenase